ERALSLVPGGGEVEGGVSGDVQFRAPSQRLSEPASWQASATVRSKVIKLYGVELTGASAGLTIKDGSATLANLKGALAGGPLTGNGSVELAGKYPYQARAVVEKLDLS